MFANSEREGQSTRIVAMSNDKLQQGHEITTVKTSTIPNIYSGIPCINMVDQVDALLKIHTEPKDIIYTGVVSSEECSTTIKTDSYEDQLLTSPILSVSINGGPLNLVREEISEILSIQTPVTAIISPAACSMNEILTTSNLLFFKSSRPITMISSIPTELRLVSCIPHNIMSPYVQPRIDYELQFNNIVARNIFKGVALIYGPHVHPRIDHLKYTMKICCTENNLTSSIDVMKITCGTQVTQSFKLKCVEKVSVTKQYNGNGINLFYPKYTLNNNPMNTYINREVYQASTNDQTTMTDF